MSKILIDILPAYGHFNGSLKLATILRNAGHNVIYLNIGSFQAELKKHRLEFVSIEQLSRQFSLSRGKFNFKLFVKRLFELNRKEFLIKENVKLQSFKKSINEIAPDLVLLDDLNMLKAVYYRLCGIDIVCLDNLPESCMIENIPPYTSFFIPSSTIFSSIFCKVLWFRKHVQNWYWLKRMQLNLVGTDYYSVTRKIAKQNNLNLKGRIDLKRGFNIGIKDIQHIIVAPSAFEFPHVQKEGVYNIGPLVDISREGEIEKRRYNVLREKLNKIKEIESGYIIYCSLGTITKSFQSRKTKFLLEMVKVAAMNTSDFFVMSVGNNFDTNQLFPMPDNMYVFEFVPQVDLLQYCDIMITHGGINTITECIFCEVPMLVYPLSLHWDQPGNSARVVYHGLGLNGRINKDSAKTISTKLNHIKSNYSMFKHNVLEMKAKFEEKNNSNEVVEIIENIINEFKQQ